MKTTQAQTKYVRSSAQKVRIIANIVRGMNAAESIEIMEYMPKKAAKEVQKVVKSAFANAVNNDEMNPETLQIMEIRVDEGPSYKRYKEGGRGSYRPFKRPTSHITVIVGNPDVIEKVKMENKKIQEVQDKAEIKPKTDKEPETKSVSNKKVTPARSPAVNTTQAGKATDERSVSGGTKKASSKSGSTKAVSSKKKATTKKTDSVNKNSKDSK